jgi:hypothetical protein
VDVRQGIHVPPVALCAAELLKDVTLDGHRYRRRYSRAGYTWLETTKYVDAGLFNLITVETALETRKVDSVSVLDCLYAAQCHKIALLAFCDLLTYQL